MTSDSIIILTFSFFLLCFVLTGLVSNYFLKGKAEFKDREYLLGGSSFGRWAVGLSAGATGNTSFIIVAAVGLGYTQGFSAFSFIISLYAGLIFSWGLFAGRIYNKTVEQQSLTVPELVSKENHFYLRSIISILFFVFIGAYLVAQFIGSAKVLTAFFQIDQNIGIFLTLVIILSYCLFGGFKASIWTDFIQAIMMFGMIIFVTGYALYEVGGFTELNNKLTEIDSTLVTFPRYESLFFYCLYTIGLLFNGIGYGLSQPQTIVRIMAARNKEEVKYSKYIFYTYIVLTSFLMIFFGIICRVLLPEIPDPEQALPVYSISRFSPVIVGLVLAGIFSTIASSADSQLLVCSSVLTHDFSEKFKQSLRRKFGKYTNEVVTLAVGLMAALAAIFASSSVFTLVMFAVSLLASSVGIAVFLVITNQKPEPKILVISMFFGVIVSLAWRYFELNSTINDAAPGMIVALGSYYALICKENKYSN